MTRTARLRHFVVALRRLPSLRSPRSRRPRAPRQSEGLAITGVDVSKAPEVTLTVAVPGSVATDQLDADAFTLLVSGDEREAELTGLPTDPMQLELVIDTSGSMQGAPMEAAKAAALRLVDQMPPAVQIGVTGFGSTPYEAAPTTTDRAVTKAAIASLQSNGETALNDAVSAATGRLNLDRRAIVLLSDGRDTASASTLEQAVGALGGANSSFYAVVLETAESDLAAANALAAGAGGRVVQAADPDGTCGGVRRDRRPARLDLSALVPRHRDRVDRHGRARHAPTDRPRRPRRARASPSPTTRRRPPRGGAAHAGARRARRRAERVAEQLGEVGRRGRAVRRRSRSPS